MQINEIIESRGVDRTKQTSKMELFAKTVNWFNPLTVSAKKLHLRCLSSSSQSFAVNVIFNVISCK